MQVRRGWLVPWHRSVFVSDSITYQPSPHHAANARIRPGATSQNRYSVERYAKYKVANNSTKRMLLENSDFRPSRLWRALVSKLSKYRKSKTCTGSVNDLSIFRLSNFAHPSPNFSGVRSAKFVLNLAFRRCSFEREQRIWKLKQFRRAPMTVLCFSKSWYSSVPNGRIPTFGVKSDVTTVFLDPDFIQDAEI